MKRKLPSPTKILSDVVMHSQPHALVRPARTPAPVAQAMVPAPQVAKQVDVAPQAPEQTMDELRAKAYREGYAKGMEEGRVAGKAAGFDAGLQEGRESGEQRGQEELIKAAQKKADRFEQIIRGVSAEIDRRFHLLEEDMVALVFETICRISGEHVMTQAGVRQAIAQAIERLGHRALLSVRLCPDDYALLRNDEEFAAMLSRLDGADNIQIIADERIKLGGCILDSTEGSLDARLETQLQKVGETLLSTRRARLEKNGPGNSSC